MNPASSHQSNVSFSRLLARIQRLGGGEGLGLMDELLLLQDSVERGCPDLYLATIVEDRVSALETTLLSCPFLEPDPSSGLSEGEIQCVRTRGGQEVNLSFHGAGNPVTHIAISGQSGSGKSCLQASVAAACPGYSSSLIIDTNRFYERIPALWGRYRYVPWAALRLNPFDDIKSVDSRQLDQVMVSEFVENYGLQFAEYEISEVTAEFRKQGLPNWFAIRDALKEKKYPPYSQRTRYRDSALLVLGNLLNATGELFSCKKGMDLSQLLAGNLVLQVHGLLPEHQGYLIRLLFSFLYLQSMK